MADNEPDCSNPNKIVWVPFWYGDHWCAIYNGTIVGWVKRGAGTPGYPLWLWKTDGHCDGVGSLDEAKSGVIAALQKQGVI